MLLETRIILWAAFWIAVLGMSLAAFNAHAETCHRKVDANVERLSGFRWSWRMVDGRKCWYYSRHILPREDLVWSFSEEEFNADIERVIERKFYKPILDENQLLIEAD